MKVYFILRNTSTMSISGFMNLKKKCNQCMGSKLKMRPSLLNFFVKMHYRKYVLQWSYDTCMPLNIV